MSRSPTNVRSGDWISLNWCSDADPVELSQQLSVRTALGFQEILENAHLIESIDADSPAALAGLLRILYALAARIAGDGLSLDQIDEDEDQGDWRQRRREVVAVGRFDRNRIAAYFDRYDDRLDLCDPHRPFLQDPRLRTQCQKTAGVNKLVFGRPAGNNHRWFGSAHSDAEPLPITMQKALQNLIAWHYFGPSGRCATRTIGSVSESNTRSGPLRSTISFHLVGPTLFHTLIAGIPTPGENHDASSDLCPWETDDLPDPTTAPPAATGTASLLTGRSQHAILLIPDADRRYVLDAYITWAWRDIIASPPDPFLCWLTSKEGKPYPRRAESARALWRDLDSLLYEQSTSGTDLRPAIFRNPAPVEGRYRVLALGFDQDGQAKDNQFVDALTPPIVTDHAEANAELGRRIGDLRRAGETVATNLDRAAKMAWSLFVAGKLKDCAWSQEAAVRYWPEAEDEFWARLHAEDFDGAHKSFRAAAIKAYNDITEQACGTIRGVKAVETARLELYGGRVKHLSKARGGKESVPK